jgi:hypothetical protein
MAAGSTVRISAMSICRDGHAFRAGRTVCPVARRGLFLNEVFAKSIIKELDKLHYAPTQYRKKTARRNHELPQIVRTVQKAP